MTHLFEGSTGKRIVAAKGAPEALLDVSRLSESEKEMLRKQIQDFGKQGYRVLGVGKAQFEGNNFPEKQQDYSFEFLGFTVFYDPPKAGIQEVFKQIKDTMLRKPRKMTETFLNLRELGISIIQGLLITAGVLFVYHFAIGEGHDEKTTRAMVFTTMIFANVLLCLVNRSFVYNVFSSLRNKNKLFPLIIGLTLLFLFAILYIPVVAAFFKLSSLSFELLGFSVLIAGISVLWFEVYKWIRFGRMRKKN